MTVEELIAILSQYDHALNVVIVTQDGDTMEITDADQDGPFVVLEVQ